MLCIIALLEKVIVTPIPMPPPVTKDYFSTIRRFGLQLAPKPDTPVPVFGMPKAKSMLPLGLGHTAIGADGLALKARLKFQGVSLK